MAKTLTAEQAIAYKNLNINPQNRVILSLDGGGIRGILTIQLLKQIEFVAGGEVEGGEIPCYKFCDLIAGTSTGAIIAGMMATGKTAKEIEELYVKFVTKVFRKRGFFANRFGDIPAYDKIDYRNILKEDVGNMTLHDACAKTNVDLLITSKNATDNEETFFTCFHNDGWVGTYKDALLRTVMEATMSAPTYFKSLERFLDGGTTTYNNPSMAAVIEALEYGGKGKYEMNEITLFSLGTGKTVKSVTLEDLAHPKGPDVLFWLNYVMDTASDDANTMQCDIFRSRILQGLDYRRFQISLDADTINKLVDRDLSNHHVVNANSLKELTDSDLSSIQLDDIHKFDLVKEIGLAMVDYIMTAQPEINGIASAPNRFQRDLNYTPTGRDELIKAFHHNIETIRANVTSAEWIDSQLTS